MAATLVSTNLTSYSGAGPFNLDYPADVASGDLLLLTLGGILVGEDASFTVPDFDLVDLQTPDEFRFKTAIYQRVAIGSEAGPVSVSQATASNGIADHFANHWAQRRRHRCVLESSDDGEFGHDG